MRAEPDGAIPVIADANSMTYVLHTRSATTSSSRAAAGEIRLRLVAALRDSIFQSELLMARAQFPVALPRAGGLPLPARSIRRPDRTDAVVAGDRGRAGRVRRRRDADGRAARGVPPGREHLPVDVPDARRARAAARHRRPGHGAAAQRARAAARAGAARRRRLPARATSARWCWRRTWSCWRSGCLARRRGAPSGHCAGRRSSAAAGCR